MNASKRLAILASALLILTATDACKKAKADDEAVQAAVRQRLASLGTLNVQAMDLDFTRVTVQDNRATAEVSFRPKASASSGAAMQVTYQLEKKEGVWGVMKTSAAGGAFEHPDPGANPHGPGTPGTVHGDLPNFHDVLDGSHSPAASSATPPAQTSKSTKP